MDLKEVERRCENAQLPLKQNATNLVFGKGNPHANILFIGEAPGAKEDEQGIPFVGRAGQNLDKLLHTIGLTLDDCYIANILKYRPPNNRDPTAEEIAAHTPFLVEQITAIKPTIIATLGNFSTKFVLAQFSVESMKHIQGVSKLHGRPHTVSAGELSFAVFPLYHPAASMYRPQLREVMEEDFVKMGEFLISHLENSQHIKDALAKRDAQKTLF